MSLKEMSKFKCESREVNDLQENAFGFGLQFNKIITDGILLTETPNNAGVMIPITIGTATTSIPHNLRRRFQGWHLIDIQGDARVWRDATVTTNLDKYIPLKASASVVVSLWVF
jgi:hypothetical protein